MRSDGVGVFVEVGPGTTVSGMIRRTVDVPTCHVEDAASRDAAIALLAADGTAAPGAGTVAGREGVPR
jgi:malonyl CoA-acyl carrier protein transacylase